MILWLHTFAIHATKKNSNKKDKCLIIYTANIEYILMLKQITEIKDCFVGMMNKGVYLQHSLKKSSLLNIIAITARKH